VMLPEPTIELSRWTMGTPSLMNDMSRADPGWITGTPSRVKRATLRYLNVVPIYAER
jgi:hypothetical protein